MIPFYPFMHKKESKKDKLLEPLPLYIEIDDPFLLPQREQKEDESPVIEIIEIF